VDKPAHPPFLGSIFISLRCELLDGHVGLRFSPGSKLTQPTLFQQGHRSAEMGALANTVVRQWWPDKKILFELLLSYVAHKRNGDKQLLKSPK